MGFGQERTQPSGIQVFDEAVADFNTKVCPVLREVQNSLLWNVELGLCHAFVATSCSTFQASTFHIRIQLLLPGVWESEALGEPSGGAAVRYLKLGWWRPQSSQSSQHCNVSAPHEIRCCFSARRDMLWHKLWHAVLWCVFMPLYASSNPSWVAVDFPLKSETCRCSFNRRLPDKTVDVMRQIEREHV